MDARVESSRGVKEVGPPPEVALLPVDYLRVDEDYQRSMAGRASVTLLARMEREFNWVLFGCLVVAQEGTNYWVVDGQHRLEVARRLGIERVPGLVAKLSRTEAAQLFVGANEGRVAMTNLAMHHARVVSGDARAVEVDDVCRRAGIKVARYPIPANKLLDNYTLGVGTLYTCVREYGADVVVHAVQALLPTYGKNGNLRAERIRGACHALDAYERTPKEVADALDGRLPDAFVRWVAKNPEHELDSGWLRFARWLDYIVDTSGV